MTKESERGPERICAGIGIQRAGREQTCVGALVELHFGVITQLHGDLAESGINAGDVAGAVL